MILSPTIALYALIAGFVPALLWLQFWLREDIEHPEPRGRIIWTFIVGMLAVAVTIPLEAYVTDHVATESFLAFLLWATIEESLKYGAAYLAALRTRYFDEPVDAVVYMITAALGFSAIENTFFILSPLLQGNSLGTAITINIRFIGASLLHIAASGIVGLAIAWAYYKNKTWKRIATVLGLCGAIALHSSFNFFIISDDSRYILNVFAGVWIAIIILIVLIERIKFIKKANSSNS